MPTLALTATRQFFYESSYMKGWGGGGILLPLQALISIFDSYRILIKLFSSGIFVLKIGLGLREVMSNDQNLISDSSIVEILSGEKVNPQI